MPSGNFGQEEKMFSTSSDTRMFFSRRLSLRTVLMSKRKAGMVWKSHRLFLCCHMCRNKEFFGVVFIQVLWEVDTNIAKGL
jgi:hypothetical protein